MTGGGWFITLEGGEGVGKSTQARRLVAYLAGRGRVAVATREPGGSAGAEAIRQVLLSGATDDLGAAAQALLVCAARADHIEKTIRPAVRQGICVVCDRFLDSTRVYQGFVGGLDERWIRVLERLTVGSTRPHLTLILDLPVPVARERVRAREQASVSGDRFERQTLDFHERLRAGFLAIAAAEPRRCALIDASGPQDAVARAIEAEVATRLFGGIGP